MARVSNVGCPNCGTPAVELRGESVGDPAGEFRDGDRLKGTTVGCTNCGDEFELYFY